MGHIRTLDIQTANSIAAGEVVERPASVVKELCENAMDAGASSISVEIRNGGVSSIQVTDNGRGMDHDDALAAFGRHATSKLRTLSDLDAIGTMGFRGEALASIAAVSRVTLHTRQPGSPAGTRVRIEGGQQMEHAVAGCPEGTTIEVENLFYNTPARYKFLKKDATEAGYIGDVVERLALSRPDISFRLVANGQEQLRTPGNNDLISAVYTVFGKQAASECIAVEHRHESLLVTGFAGIPENARSNRSRQILHVNGRAVQSKVFSAAVDEAYRNRMMKGKHPFVLMRLEIPPNLVDVNVHPQKLEVRFWNDGEVFLAILHALKSVLETHRPGETQAAGEDDRHSIPSQTGATDATSSAQPAGERAAPPSDGEATGSGVLPQPGIQSWLPVDGEVVTSAFSSTETQPPVPSVRDDKTDGQVAEPPAPYVVQTADPFFSKARYIGIAFGTYVLLEDREDLVLMDQHAAHERILFERLLKRASSGSIQAQSLLVPASMEITSREAGLLEARREKIEEAGFRFDFLGAHAVAVRAIPGNEEELSSTKALRALLDVLADDLDGKREDIKTEILASIACKAAIKAGDRVDATEVKALLSGLSGLENPYQCPHGRPILFRMSRRELEKRFKRIV